MKIWSSKYALTAGITEHEVEPPSADIPGVVTDRSGNYPQYFHGEGKDWHRSQEDARKRAEIMRTNKIHSLERQIARLKRLKF